MTPWYTHTSASNYQPQKLFPSEQRVVLPTVFCSWPDSLPSSLPVPLAAPCSPADISADWSPSTATLFTGPLSEAWDSESASFGTQWQRLCCWVCLAVNSWSVQAPGRFFSWTWVFLPPVCLSIPSPALVWASGALSQSRTAGAQFWEAGLMLFCVSFQDLVWGLSHSSSCLWLFVSSNRFGPSTVCFLLWNSF